MAGSEGRVETVQASATASEHTSRYSYYVLGVLFLSYVCNVMDRSVLSVLLESIKAEFQVSDTLLGLLSGIAFASFYATFGIPIAAWADRTSRRNVLALAVATWSAMTALCGVAVSYTMLLLARIGTAVGEAGGSPPSHSLISDYFPLSKRATALSIFALGVPAGGMLGNFLGGWGDAHYGWRMTFILLGLPGLAIALLVRLTVREPPRGQSDRIGHAATHDTAPPVSEALRYMWKLPSFRHLTLAAGLHSVVWYSGSSFNAAFFIRSHELSSFQAGSYLSMLLAIGAVGTFLGGYLADRFSVRAADARWYMWVPGYATIGMVPFQFTSYLLDDMQMVLLSFGVMTILASFFFGPSFAMTQALAPLRMRSVATSVLLFVQTLIGLGLGPLFVGIISDALKPTMGMDSLRYGLVIVGSMNIWAAAHYFLGTRTLREDLALTRTVSG